MVEQQGLFRDPAETGREDTIQSGTFGGLNTTSNALNTPWTDSPEMLNVDVTIGGEIVRRNGTRLLGSIDAPEALNIDQFRLGSGLSYLAVKAGRNLSMYEVIEDELVELLTFENVWSDAASGEKAGTVLTNEVEPRLLYFTGSNAPVQLHAVEISERVTAADTSYSIEDRNDRFEFGVPGVTMFAYLNTQRLDPSAYSLVDGNLVLTTAVVPGDVVTFLNITWQWWAEAELYSVNRFYDVRTRFNVDESDRNIAVPDNLRDGAELDTFGLYRIYATWGGDGSRDDSYFVRAIRPAQGFQYMTSNGSLNLAGATWDFPPVGSASILFGGLSFDSSDPPEILDPYTVHMLRIRRLSMNGGRGILNGNLLVQGYDFDSPYTITQAGSSSISAFAGWLGFDSDNWSDPDAFDSTLQDSNPKTRIPIPLEQTDTTTPLDYIMLDRGGRRGAPLDDLVRFINLEPQWVGTSAVGSLNKYRLGYAVPAYGLGKFANYGQGLFPNTGALYGGRLVIGGVVSNPMRVLFSSTVDSEFPGDRYQGFTIDPFQPEVTTAFDLDLAGSTSEIVEAIIEYAGSVFIATSESLYRIFSRNPLNAQTALVQLAGKAGALNSQAFSIGGGTLYYLGRQGVYIVKPTDGLDDSYTIEDVALKIRDRISQEESLQARRQSSIKYSPESRKLYVTVVTQETETEMYVLNTERMAWTQYESYDRWRVFGMAEYRDFNGKRHFCIVHQSADGLTNRFIRTEWLQPLDFVSLHRNVATYVPPARAQDVLTTVADVQRYPHRLNTVGFNDVEDLVVLLDGVELTFQDDWAKQGRQSVYLRSTPEAGQELRIRGRNTTDDLTTVAVYRNSLLVPEGETWDWDGETITFEDVSETVEYMVGLPFTTVFKTPVFSWNLLANFKRGIKWSGLFNNKPNQNRFTTELDVPAEDLSRLVGLPIVPVDTNLAIVYDNEREGSSSYDLFRLGELIYDISLMDSYGGPYTEDEYVQIVEPLQGTGYSIQVALWSDDANTFVFSGYQLVAQPKGKRYSGDRR